MGAARYRINPALDSETLSRAFRERSRIHIPNFLTPGGAEELLDAIEQSDAWTLVMNQGDKLLELNRRLQADITPQKQALIDQAIFAAAQDGFQFRYKNIRVPNGATARAAIPGPLSAFADFLSGEAALSFIRSVTGADDITFADARATNYGPGDFLTAHDDDAENQSRRIAYVFNLSKRWNADWGGLLTFPDEANRHTEAFIPAFNSMNLFSVPQRHSVSFVTPFAGARRYSVTGWLHAGTKP